ncbi:MAG: glucose-6-phosphate dehydrogenase assembly protein OpcA [Deltaproteobacteria bacterium]|nr:glucose-6-phosphate dehydrogenase assembly protein OpcA [Deltaproteobacteria bacterium]
MAPIARHPLELGPTIPVEGITAALRARREELARGCNDPNAMRVCTMNLVAFCHDEDRCVHTHEVLTAMVVEHPGRLFLVHAHREAPKAALEARVAVDGTPMGAGIAPTYSELIDLKATGADVEYLPALLTSLLESDQPACAWWATPPTFGPNWHKMARVCDRMVVDTAQLDPWDLMRLVEYVKSDTEESRADDHAALGDLNWARIKPFTALTARFFDSPEVRERFAAIDRIVVRHTPPQGSGTAIGPAMLGAWVRDRLHKTAKLAHVKVSPRVELVRAPRSDLGPGEVSELVLHGDGAKPIELAVVRQEDAGMVVAEPRQGVVSLQSQRQRLQTASRSWLLAQELQITSRDPLFEAAYLGAIELLREARQ